MKRLFTLALVAILAMACTEREWDLAHGYDSSSYISALITGTSENYDNKRFMSDTGRFTDESHPEFRMHDDGTFSFDLGRMLYTKKGEMVWINFHWENLDGKITLDKVYSLMVIGDSRATLKSASKEYKATNGWIEFTSKRVYDGGMLYSGEFWFEAIAEDGTKVTVTDGSIIDCRICIADDYGCVER